MGQGGFSELARYLALIPAPIAKGGTKAARGNCSVHSALKQNKQSCARNPHTLRAGKNEIIAHTAQRFDLAESSKRAGR